jgi:hypothetical protein
LYFVVSLFRSLNSSAWSEIYGGSGFSSTISKGTTTIIWNIHSNPHDFSLIGSSSEVSRKVISSNLAHLSLVSVWFSVIFYSGSYFSNFDSWILSPANAPQSSQVVSEVLGQSLINYDYSYSSFGIRILSGLFNIWLSWGIVSSANLIFSTPIHATGFIVFS